MDYHDIEKATMLGHSMGARVGMRFATHYPDRTDGVIAVDSAPVNLNPVAKPNETSRLVMKHMKDVTDRELTVKEVKKEIEEQFKDQKNIV